jgi:oxygen-independent coproporphyrinogen-3 oxidase
MSENDPATAVGSDPKDTGVGSVFVSNYPPYSFWGAERVPRVHEAVEQTPVPETPLGIYAHIPFCRRRCKFCYFRVFVDKNAAEIQRYVDALKREIEIYAGKPLLNGRQPKFVYFGGGTPSFISSRHLRELVEAMQAAFPWQAAEEVAFECEPGTLTHQKLETIRELGITRISLGVENFDDGILEANGRAHVSKEIHRCVPWIRELEFDQVNIDLIAGMVGETWDTWKESVRKAIEMGPDSVTVYQMELPYNTVYSRQVLDGGGVPIADWATKRAWHDYAFEQFEQSGYEVSSAYTVVKKSKGARFVYRDSVWRGCDLMSIGVSSFGHLRGAHYQNSAGWDAYLQTVESNALPIERAFVPVHDERLTREMILQLKLGRLDAGYFREKFGANIIERFGEALERLKQRKMLDYTEKAVTLTREGLLRVDSLLPEFYAETYQNARYT